MSFLFNNKISGWGLYPKYQIIKKNIKNNTVNYQNIIPRGNGRSYGDSSISNKIVITKKLNKIISYNAQKGLINVQSGVKIQGIINLVLGDGWFLNVTPGSKFVTIGGCVASDVHGKNHHNEGSFDKSILSFRLKLSDNKIITCSKKKNSQIYKATVGGMGLTGLIIDIKIKLKKIKSSIIKESTFKTKNLIETIKLLSNKKFEYSVAWIDAKCKKNYGKGIIFFGDHYEKGKLTKIKNKKKKIYFPSFFLNRISNKIFNYIYYQFHKRKIRYIDYDEFFYPLDNISNWNEFYGQKGFFQYQFVVPKKFVKKCLGEILKKVSSSKFICFLATLKMLGKKNKNYLSFAKEGFTLALDFKFHNEIFDFFEILDQIVIKYNGRIYLTKDARLKKKTFYKMDYDIKSFNKARKKFRCMKINSFQSKRLGI